MGFSIIEARFIESALKMGILPAGVSVLELGESNVIPEHVAPDLLAILAPYLPADRVTEALRQIAQSSNSRSRYQKTFGTARALYRAIFDLTSYTAIDLDIGPRRYCFDLNGPVEMNQRFDCVINNGTSEHVFDQANVFRIMHDHTRPGGVIINWTPCLGWIDHGFYNVQPGFFFDLSRANGYEIDLIALTTDKMCYQLHSGNEVWGALRAHPELSYSAVCTVLRKTADAPFMHRSRACGCTNRRAWRSPLCPARMYRRCAPTWL